MVSKYEPLSRELSKTTAHRIRYAFDEIEAILGFRLVGSPGTELEFAL